MRQDELAILLQEKEERTKIATNKNLQKPLKARANASLTDMIALLIKLCDRSLQSYKAVFNPDEGAVIKDVDKPLEHPVILYEIIDRKPKLELKPRQSEEIIETEETDGGKRLGRIWTQRFSCVVQFNVIASDYQTANAVMNILEDVILTYTGYLKSEGVAEIIFKRQFTDKNLDKYRQRLSVRSLQYDVEIEKITTLFDTTISEIST